MFRGRDHAFEREELQLLCLELVLGEIPTNGASTWLPLCDPDGLIEILWQTGFLTAQPVGDTDADGGQGAFIGVHQVQHLNLAAVQRFQVHPMFRAYLGVQRRNGD